jgi:hypothetical protein
MPQPFPDELPARGGERYDPCRPILPPGYQAQQAWGFRGTDGECFYEFSRVYGPAVQRDGRGPVGRLHQDLSYWSVIWPVTGRTGDQHPAGRWVTYGQAHQKHPRLGFDHFSSPGKMRDELPALFRGD